jgi:hypothetical protein
LFQQLLIGLTASGNDKHEDSGDDLFKHI